MRKTFWLYSALCLAPVLLMLACVQLVFGSEAATFTYFLAKKKSCPELTLVMNLISDFGNACFYMLYARIIYEAWRCGDRRLMRFVMAYILVQVLVSFLLIRLLKLAIGRPRPETGGPYQPFNKAFNYQAMPSGHTTEALTSALPLALYWRNLWVSLGFGVFAALIAFSRIYLTMHHASDILGGVIAGLFGGWLIWRLGLRNMVVS